MGALGPGDKNNQNYIGKVCSSYIHRSYGIKTEAHYLTLQYKAHLLVSWAVMLC